MSCPSPRAQINADSLLPPPLSGIKSLGDRLKHSSGSLDRDHGTILSVHFTGFSMAFSWVVDVDVDVDVA